MSVVQEPTIPSKAASPPLRGLPLPPALQLILWTWWPLPLLEYCNRHYGSTFLLKLPDRTLTITSDPRAIRTAFVAQPHQYEVRDVNQILKPLVGENSLLLLDGQRHLRERRLLMPPFHGERMQLYAEVMRRTTAETVAKWPRDGVIELHRFTQSITLDVILHTVFGLGDASTDAQFAEIRRLLVRQMALAGRPIMLILWASGGGRVPWFLKPFARKLGFTEFDELQKRVDAHLYQLIARRRDEEAHHEGKQDVLSLLVGARDENGEALTDVELRDEMMTILLAGHETSATALCWLFYLLLANPHTLQRVREEIDSVLNGEPLQAQHVSRLSYLDAAIKEALRLRPILPFVSRRLLEPMQAGDLWLPAGTGFTPCIYLTHRRADLWPDPLRFDPERFLDDRINPAHWFPFGGGGRRCLGIAFAMFEMKVVTAEILRTVDLELPKHYRPKPVRRGITFTPSGGVPLRVRPRS